MAAENGDVERRLWAVADQLRANSGLKPSEYSRPVLGLLFLRYADGRFAEAEKALQPRPGSRLGAPTPDAFKARGVIYLTPEARFSHLPRRAARPGRERLSRRHDRLAGGRRNDPHDVAEAAGKERARRHRRDRAPHRRSDRGRGDRSAAAEPARTWSACSTSRRSTSSASLNSSRAARGRPRPKSCAGRPRSGRGRWRAATRHASISSNG